MKTFKWTGSRWIKVADSKLKGGLERVGSGPLLANGEQIKAKINLRLFHSASKAASLTTGTI